VRLSLAGRGTGASSCRSVSQSGLAGWGLYIVALDLAPLSLVQATSASGVGLLALLVRAGGVRLSARELAHMGSHEETRTPGRGGAVRARAG
jgi:hypothetical protein